MANTQYKARGSDTRKQVYTLVIAVGAVVLAGLVSMGILTADQIEGFVELSVYLVGVLGGVGALVSGALARNNVDPPADDLPAGEPYRKP